MEENSVAWILLSWLPMLLVIGVWIVVTRKYGAGRIEIVDEYKKHNELLRQIIDRMDQRISCLEDRDRTNGFA